MKLRLSILLTALLALFIIPTQAQDSSDVGLNDVITFEGEVQSILSSNAFIVERTEPFDFTPSTVIVFNDDTNPFAIDVNRGRQVEVTGKIEQFSLADVLDDVTYSVDASLFDTYDAQDYAVVATTVTDPTALPPAADFTYDPDVVVDVEADPTAYYGDTFTIEGYVAEILSPYSFRLIETQPFDLSPASFIVINDDTTPFAVDVNVGRHLRVTGPLYNFDVATIDSTLDYNLNPDYFVDYGTEDYTMIGESVMAVSARTSDTTYPPTTTTVTDEDDFATFTNIDTIEDDPFAYVGEDVIIEGEVEEIYTDQSFLLEEDEFFDLHPMQVPVFASSDVNYPIDGIDLMDLIDDELYEVTGEVVAFDLLELENRLGYTLNADYYLDFDRDNIAIIATDVTRVEE